MRASKRGLLPFVLMLVLAGSAIVVAPAPAVGNWVEDAKQAAIGYADEKKNELVKEQAKAAIFSLYKKLYSAKSGASRALSRQLAEIAISAPELNKLAEETAEAYGSGDPDKMREASQKVAVKFGEQLSKFASTAELRGQLGAVIGSADKVKEISELLGGVAAGTDASRRAAAEYVGQALINLTPGAGIVGFYQSAYGAMSYANSQFVDSKVEDLYRDYRSGRLSRDGLIAQLESGTAGYRYVVETRRQELEAEKTAAIGDAAGAASDRVREHLTKTTEEEIIAGIVASFDSRIEKERGEAGAAAGREKAQKEAEAILNELDWAAKGRHGSGWYEKSPVNLDKFAAIVRDQLKADGVLDPNDPLHVKLMSKAASIALIYGKNSKEYAKVLDELAQAKQNILDANKGAPCTDGSPAQALAARLWQKGKQLAAAGKTGLALPPLRQSLELCPDEDRAAQLAELSKAAAPQDYDGVYAGTMRFPASAKTDGSLKLTVAGGQVSGSYLFRSVEKDRTATQEATISGRVSGDGRIAAAIAGKNSIATSPALDFGGQAVIIKLLGNYTFQGSFSGAIAGKTASGAVSAQRPSLTKGRSPMSLKGSWRASRP